ncbi:MAG: NfeD family protein [Phycisphaerales bacterium]
MTRTRLSLRSIRLLVALAAALGTLLTTAWPPAEASARQPQSSPQAASQGAGASGGTITGAVAAANKAENLAIITIHGPIDAFTAQSIRRRIAAAEAGGADAIVFDIDTPGGELKAALEICDAIKGTSVPLTVAWVHPNAYSAGAIIALSCRQIVASDPATMGDALVILGGPMGFQSFDALPEQERQKVLSPLLAEVVNSARRNGYDEMLVQGIVTRGVELWQVRDTTTGRTYCVNEDEYRELFDGPPPRSNPIIPSARGRGQMPSAAGPTEPDPTRPLPSVREGDRFQPANPELSDSLAAAINSELTEATDRPTFSEAEAGRYEFVRYVTPGDGAIVMKTDELMALGVASAVVRNQSELESHFGAVNVVRLDESWSERFARFMVQMPVRFVLVVVFLIAMFIEMTHPGATVPAFVALIALGGLIAPSMLVGMAAWWEIAAILGGIALMAVEVFVIPGFGIFGVAGIALLFGGLLGVIMPGGGRLFPGESGGQSALVSAAMLLAAVVTSGVIIYFLARHLGSLPILNRLVLQDDPDRAIGTLSAMGSPDHPLMGLSGRAATDLRPAGRAEIDGQLIDVVAELGYIPAGTPVRVVSASLMRIGVEPATGADGPGPGSAGDAEPDPSAGVA